MCEFIEKKADIRHTLEIHPFAWMQFYNEPESEISRIRDRIIEETRALERAYRVLRSEEEKSVLGSEGLYEAEPSLAGWKPKKRQNRPLMICYEAAVRKEYYDSHVLFCKAMGRCYEIFRDTGRICTWPEGGFMPPLVPRDDRHLSPHPTL
jgi:hypothetical protein